MDDFNYRIIQLANNKGTVLVDAEDYEEINSYNWSITSQGYAKRYATKSDRIKGSGGTIPMHRQVMGMEYSDRSIQVDHIFGSKLDNRKSKLRKCTNQENKRNSSHQLNSTTKVKGVYPVRGKFRAQIRHNQKLIHLGYYNDINDAIESRKEAEIKLGWKPALNTKLSHRPQ